MSKMTISFDEMPLWLTHEEAGKLIPSRQLKELREGGSLRFRTIEGKLSYFLIDVLKAKGIENVLVHAEAPIVENKAVSEVPESIAEPAKEAPKEEQKVDAPYQFQFADVFFYPTNGIDAGEPLPTLRIRKAQNTHACTQVVKGKIVDIQRFMGRHKDANYPKFKIVIQSLEYPHKFMVIQTRYDMYHGNYLANTIAELLARPTVDFSQVFNLRLGTRGENQITYDVSIGAEEIAYINPTAHRNSVEYKYLEPKIDNAIAGLKESGNRMVVFDKSKDFNYQAYQTWNQQGKETKGKTQTVNDDSF